MEAIEGVRPRSLVTYLTKALLQNLQKASRGRNEAKAAGKEDFRISAIVTSLVGVGVIEPGRER